MSTATLLLGVLSIIFPIFYSIITMQIFYMLINKNIMGDSVNYVNFAIYAGYTFFSSYFLILILGGTLGIIDLFRKQKFLHKENMKTLLGLALILFSLVVIGRIFIFSELFHFIIGGGNAPEFIN
jgi:hypothetical protein